MKSRTYQKYAFISSAKAPMQKNSQLITELQALFSLPDPTLNIC